MHLFHTPADEAGNHDLDNGGNDGSQRGQVDGKAVIARFQTHEREPVIDAEDVLWRNVQVKLINNEEQQDWEKIEKLFHGASDSSGGRNHSIVWGRA